MDTHAEEIQDTLNLLMDTWHLNKESEHVDMLNNTRDSKK